MQWCGVVSVTGMALRWDGFKKLKSENEMHLQFAVGRNPKKFFLPFKNANDSNRTTQMLIEQLTKDF